MTRLFNKILEQGYICTSRKTKIVSEKVHVRYEDLIEQYEGPSHKCERPFCSLTIHNDAHNRSDFVPNHHHITEVDLLPNHERFP